MKWFDKWLFKRVQHGSKLHVNDKVEAAPNNSIASSKMSTLGNNGRSPDMQGVHFILYPAVGGNIVELRSFDERKDRNETKLHIITSDQDLGQSLAHIITYTSLTR